MPSLFNYPVYNNSLQQENRIINVDHIEQVMPHADVPVDGTPTACCEFNFIFGTSCIVLLEYAVVQAGLKAYLGIIDGNGNLL